jgi:hypothetical protein
VSLVSDQTNPILPHPILLPQEALKYLAKHFSSIHTCDQETIDAINLPVTDFTLAIK